MFGIYADPNNCNRFYKCDNSTAVPDSCPQNQVFDNEKKLCRTPTEEDLVLCEKPVTEAPLIGKSNNNNNGNEKINTGEINLATNFFQPQHHNLKIR